MVQKRNVSNSSRASRGMTPTQEQPPELLLLLRCTTLFPRALPGVELRLPAVHPCLPPKPANGEGEWGERREEPRAGLGQLPGARRTGGGCKPGLAGHSKAGREKSGSASGGREPVAVGGGGRSRARRGPVPAPRKPRAPLTLLLLQGQLVLVVAVEVAPEEEGEFGVLLLLLHRHLLELGPVPRHELRQLVDDIPQLLVCEEAAPSDPTVPVLPFHLPFPFPPARVALTVGRQRHLHGWGTTGHGRRRRRCCC